MGFGLLSGFRKHASPCFICPAHFTDGKREAWSIEEARTAAQLLRAELLLLSEPGPGVVCLCVCLGAKKEDNSQSGDVDPCMCLGFWIVCLFLH